MEAPGSVGITQKWGNLAGWLKPGSASLPTSEPFTCVILVYSAHRDVRELAGEEWAVWLEAAGRSCVGSTCSIKKECWS